MKRYMKRIFKRIENGIFVKSDSEQMALEIKNLEARIAGLDEQAAMARTLRRRIADLEAAVDLNEACFQQEYKARSTAVDMLIERDKRIAELEASQAKRTQLVVDATLRKVGR